MPQRIDGNTDVDVMVVFRKKEYQPDTFLKHLREFADKIYPRSQVSPDYPAITVVLHHTKFELVPGYWEQYIFSSELNIPAPKIKEVKWISTDPDGFFSALKEKDKKNNGLIIPLIKILKYFNSKQNYAYSSSVIEGFVINCGYWGNTLAEKFFEVIDAMTTSNLTAVQIDFVNELKQRKKNLLALANANLDEYIKMEMEKFLPSINC